MAVHLLQYTKFFMMIATIIMSALRACVRKRDLMHGCSAPAWDNDT